jgi:hypothetical protein
MTDPISPGPARVAAGRVGALMTSLMDLHVRIALQEVDREKRRLISGVGTYPVLGSYDDVADHFRRMSEAGLDGVALGIVNYISEMPHLQEVLAQLERMGLRVPQARVAHA